MNKRDKESRERTFHLYCQLSTCAGISDWYYARRFAGKLFWATLVIAGLALTTVQTVGTFTEYLRQSPYETSITRKTSETGAVRFPYLTVCNFNRAKQSLIEKTKLDPKVLMYLFSFFPTIYDISLSYIKDTGQQANILASWENAWTNYLENGGISDIYKFLDYYAHGFDETLLMFNVDGEQGRNLTKTRVYTSYGACWKIDFNATQKISGPVYGIGLKLDPMLNEYMRKVVFNNFLQQGFVISLHYIDDPFLSNPIFLRPGISAYIAIHAVQNTVKRQMFPLRRRKCNANAELTIVDANYSSQNCVYDCYAKHMVKKINCTVIIKTKSSYPICTNLSLFSSVRSNNVDSACIETCENPCYEFYTVESSITSTAHAVEYALEELLPVVGKLIANSTSEKAYEAAINSVALKIYFGTTEITVSETSETTPIMTFISDIGGQLSLWLGISLFSLIQFFYYIILGCCRIKDHINLHNENSRNIENPKTYTNNVYIRY